jgi:cell division protein FtsW
MTVVGQLRPLRILKAWSSLGTAPRNPRTMPIYDASLAWCAILLLAIGLVMVYSASIAMAEASAHTGYRSWYFLARHAIFVAIGVLAAFVAFQMPMRGWQRLAPWIFVVGIVLLMLVFVPGVGKSVNGSRRWISLVLVNIQPSEFIKLAVVLYAASYAVRKAAFLHAEQPSGRRSSRDSCRCSS